MVVKTITIDLEAYEVLKLPPWDHLGRAPCMLEGVLHLAISDEPEASSVELSPNVTAERL